MSLILLIGPGAGIDSNHLVCSKFSSRKTLFDICSQATLKEVTILSNKLVSKIDAPGLIEISKNKFFCKCLFNSSGIELQNHLSLNADVTLHSGLITLKVLINHVTQADRKSA